MITDSIKTDINVPVPMRDGTVLRADVFRPDGAGPFPTLVLRTPYDKWRSVGFSFMDPMRLARNGYAVVLQDCRGCHGSEGQFDPYVHEAQDGHDTIEWAASQSWSNQRVGTFGYSYAGSTQWLAASERPPHLMAIAPASSPSSARNALFGGGVFRLQLAQTWTLAIAGMLARRQSMSPSLVARLRELLAALATLPEQAMCLPLNAWPVACQDAALAFYSEWLAHPDNDDYWQERDMARCAQTDVPAFIVAGWNDLVSAAGSLSSYSSMKHEGATDSARQHTRLIIGPWGHELQLMQKVGDIDYGVLASGEAIDLMGLHLRWYDYWLKGVDNGILAEPPVRIFVMGDNVWRNEHEWPLARTLYTNFYLRAGADQANGTTHGGLSQSPPLDELPDRFDYDPLDPVPTHGGSVLSMVRDFGPLDQRGIEQRADVLVYSTPILEQDMEVTGPVSMVLYAQSSAPDTDFTAKLIDVLPDGRAYILLDGIVRARYRNGDTASLLVPEQVYEYRIDMAATSNVFKAGHRLRVEISSSNFPKYDRNPNTGHAIGTDAASQVAAQAVYHDADRPSHLILPLIARPPTEK